MDDVSTELSMLAVNVTVSVIGLLEVCICDGLLLLLANSDVDALDAIGSVMLEVGIMLGLEPVTILVLGVSNSELGIVANVEKLDVGGVKIELALAAGIVSLLPVLLIVKSVELGKTEGVAVTDAVTKVEVAVA